LELRIVAHLTILYFFARRCPVRAGFP
jgi:hypothetical protein